ncbi:PH domain-containing protein [Evansella halocellulosilytica]|uniref:PH domain-containing protein n=1 Tax=Evansella halocellulosilytica TaxID=2011013 RepID=UPI000BB8602C|nr:PH domain-containing protein [Evansella halocellulosilytica]
MVFTSKKDIWLGIPIWASIIAFLLILYEAISQLSIVVIILVFIFLCFLGSIWLHTRYIIQDELLIIKYGLIKQTININDIKSFRKTTNPFVSPSLSIHRIEITYNKYETVQVSPKEINLFVEELQKRNSDIQVKNI